MAVSHAIPACNEMISVLFQLSHKVKFVIDSMISMETWEKYIPKPIYPLSLYCNGIFNQVAIDNKNVIRHTNS